MWSTRAVRPSASAQRSVALSKAALLRLPGNRVAISRQVFACPSQSRRAAMSCMAVLGDVRSPGFGAQLFEHVREGVRQGKAFMLLKATPTAVKVGRKNIPEKFVCHIVEFEATASGFSVTDGPLVHVSRKAKAMNVHVTFVATDGAVTRRLVGLRVRAVVRRTGRKEYQVYGLHTYLREMGAGHDDLVLVSTDGRQSCDTALQVLVIPQEALDQEARDKLAPFLISKPPACRRAAHKPRRVRAKKASKSKAFKAAGAAEATAGGDPSTASGPAERFEETAAGGATITVGGDTHIDTSVVYMEGVSSATFEGNMTVKGSTIHMSGRRGDAPAAGTAPGAEPPAASKP